MNNWIPELKLLRAAGIIEENHAARLASLPEDTQKHICTLISDTGGIMSKPAPLKNRCAVPDQKFVKYLLASYLYYEEDFSAMSDSAFDLICLELSEEHKSVTHWARNLIDKEALLAGTGYYLFGKMPPALIAEAKLWREEIERDN